MFIYTTNYEDEIIRSGNSNYNFKEFPKQISIYPAATRLGMLSNRRRIDIETWPKILTRTLQATDCRGMWLWESERGNRWWYVMFVQPYLVDDPPNLERKEYTGFLVNVNDIIWK